MTVEELISKVSISGDAKYLSTLGKMDAAAQRHGHAVAGMANRVTGAFASIGRAMSSPMGLLGAGAGAGGLLGIGALALKASGDVEQLRVTLEALTGSAEIADRKIQFMRQLAIPSPFTFQQLAEAGTQLESFGLRVEKVLPLASKLGAAFGADSEMMQMIGRLFGRLAAGDFPDIEVMARVGLNKSQFQQQGVKFDSQGRMLSSAREALDALERIINSKYGNILEKISSTTNAKLATLQDKWQQVMIKVGDSIAKYVLPWLDRLTNYLDKLAQSDSIAQFTKKLLGNFARIVAVTSVVVHGILLIVATLKLLSKDWAGAFVATLAAFSVLYGGLKTALWIRNMGRQIPTGGASTAMPAGSEEGPWSATGDDSALGTMARIEKNTARTAKATEYFSGLDLKKFIFGGPAGDVGYDATDVSKMRRRAPAELKVTGGTVLENAIGKMVMDGLMQLQRQGRITVH